MPHKLDQKGFSHIVLILFFVLVIAFVGAAGWKVYSQRSKASPSTSSNANSSVISKQTLTASQIITAIKSDVGSKLTPVKDTTTPLTSGEVNFSQLVGGPIWKPSGSSFFVIPSHGVNLTIAFYNAKTDGTPSPDGQTVKQVLDSQFTAFGLAKITDKNEIWSEDSNFGVSVYRSGDMICDRSDNVTNSQVSCADAPTYTKEASEIKPLADAYLKANPTSDMNVFGVPKVKDSKTPGYKIASMALNDAVSELYEKNGTWTFYVAGQFTMSCDFTGHEDARLAFLGEPCFDDTTHNNSTVQ